MKLFSAMAVLLSCQLSSATAATAPTSATARTSEYRMSGTKALHPSKIRDDGFYTYIEWPSNAELPAVFSRASDGREVIAEGVMMDDVYVLDRVHAVLIFRIDRQTATASRRAKRHE